MQLDKAFCPECYFKDKRFHHSFFRAVMNVLLFTQHIYDRKDLSALYHFIGDMMEKGDFDWSGKKHLNVGQFSDIVKTNKNESNNRTSVQNITSDDEVEPAKPDEVKGRSNKKN